MDTSKDASDSRQAADESVAGAKRSLRAAALRQRRAVPAEQLAGASDRICATLRTLPELQDRAGLLLYVARPDEVDLGALLADPPGHGRILLPRVAGDRLEVVAHLPGRPLRPGSFGILEPIGPDLGSAAIDAVVAPGVSFDTSGRRLGSGRGFYDRLIPTLGPGVPVIGVLLESLLVAHVPVEPHDRTMDLIVTDASVRRIPHASRPARP
jgi:5-formyltetrahydrofolate cyclo-ligase